jgi:hypothetical protein
MTEKQCGCQTQGLAILPVRYTVVPTYLKRTSPAWASSSNITTVPLDADYQYHVRSMRSGFLYVYLPNEIGSDKWQVYTIDHDGNLYKQNSPDEAQTIEELAEGGGFRCPNLKNNETHNKFITIPCPKEQNEVYLAFSEIPLDEKILKKHEQQPEKRMQKISTEQWKEQQQKSLDGITTATKQTIEQILDLDPNFDQQQLPYDHSDSIVTSYLIDNQEESKKQSQIKVHYSQSLSYNRQGVDSNTKQGGNQPFGYDSKVLKKNTTTTPWTKQQGLSATIANTMDKYSAGYSPLIIAIDDPIGIAKELNGYCNELYAKNDQYRQERAQEFDAYASYEYGIELLIHKEFADDFNFNYTNHPYFKRVMQEKKLPETEELPVFSTFNQLSVLIQEELYGKPYSKNYQDCTEMYDNFIAKRYRKEKYYEWERNYFLHGKNYSEYHIALESNNNKYPISNFIDKRYIEYFDSPQSNRNEQNLTSYFKAEKFLGSYLESYRKKEDQYQQDKIDKINSIRKKYDKCLDTQTVNSLNQQYEKLQQEITTLAEQRAQQLISWLKMSNFYLHIKDFDGDIWESVSDTDPNEKRIDNQFEVEQAIADNELTGDAQQKIAEQLNLYGIYYSAVIDKCTSGLELTDIGKLNLKIWLQASNASEDTSDSIMVRALANNSETLLTDIQAMLEQIENHHEPIELSEVMTTSKVGKIAAYYKKTQGFLNAVNNYYKELDKAKNVLKNHPDTLGNVAKLGIKMPGNERLLKIFLSKPVLSVNNLAVRLCNIMFSPLNNSSTINKINHHACLMLNLSFFGLYKKAQQAILQAENNVSNAVVNSQWFKNALPKTQTLPGGVVMQLTKKMRESDLKAKSEYVKQLHNKNRVISRVLDIKEAGRNTKILKAKKEDIDNIKVTRSQPSKGFKDIRLAFVIAAFEIYNWLQIKDKTQGDHNDSFWSAEMIGASLAMTSATTELMYQFVKTVTGSGSVAAGRIKVMSGFFGAAAGLYVSCQKFMKAWDEIEKENISLSALNFTSGILYLGNAGLGFATATTYHIPWLTSRITKRALAKGLSRKLIARAIAIYTAQIMARRVMLLALGFWVGVLSLLIEGLIWYISDNELESWIKLSALGVKNDNAKAYKNLIEQQDAFKEALQEMFGIDKSTVELNQQNQLTAKATTAQQPDSEAEHDFNEFDALLLITNDLERRHQAKREALAIKNQPKSNYSFNPNAITDYFRGIN